MKLMRNRFQKSVVALIVGWLTLFVFLPNLMIIVTSFLTRDDAHFVSTVFTLKNYTRLLDPLYAEVLLHSLIWHSLPLPAAYCWDIRLPGVWLSCLPAFGH